MSETLKLLTDLNQMSTSMEISILRHLFTHYDPSTSKSLRETISHFHIRDIEASDYRSACHQFCDWLYGWNVTDVTDFAEKSNSATDYLQMKRVPRDIDFEADRERVEAERIMKTFETLCSLSRRHLKKLYGDIETQMPRVGQGLDTLSTNAKKNKKRDEEFSDIEGDPDLVWASHNAEFETLEFTDSANDMKNGSANNDENINDEDNIDEGDFPDDNDGDENGSNENLKISGDVAIRRRSDVNAGREDDENDPNGEENSTLNSTDNLKQSTNQITETGIASGRLIQQTREENDSDDESDANSKSVSRAQTPGNNNGNPERKSLIAANGQPGFSFLDASGRSGIAGGGFSETIDETHRALQRDVNHMFAEVDQCLEYTLICMSNILMVLTFAELLGEKELFAKFCNFAHELSMEFVSNTLKASWDLINKEIPGDVTLGDIRDPARLKEVIKKMLDRRSGNEYVPKNRMRKISFKFATLHDMFVATDIHIFPNFIEANKEGTKCAKFSAFDSFLWLTGGYDCVIRITDIRSTKNHVCLAQYVGHKSIITDVHFCKNDSQIVSSSFDRTVKIWNAQQAITERTLTGHTDAVMSCDVTFDGRYIASGSMDSTVRFWDANNGECITVIKKHTKWVKVVRFSLDGKQLATAGMDRKIYIWDTKSLANSRSPTHARCIDNFGDYVLDMAMTKPSLLLATARDSTIRLFDYLTGHELQCFNLTPSWACAVAFSNNGEYFATGSFDNNVLVFRTRDFAKMREIRVFNLGIMCIRFPKDLDYVVVGTTEGFLQQITL